MTTDITHLARRRGPRPITGPLGGHTQRDQNGPADLGEQLLDRMTSLPGVYTGPSGISAPSSRAVHLPLELALGPSEAFIVHTEFAHLHATADGSLHATLPSDIVPRAVELGWAELHPAVLTGARPPTLVMLYSPRDADELEAIWTLVAISHAFASGRQTTPAAA